MLRIFLTALAWAMLAASGSAQGFSGRIGFIDADTLDVGAVRVRLYGIDAPEVGQPCFLEDARRDCGTWARRRAMALFENRLADCERITTDRYGRAVARCETGGQDISERLVSDGLAMAYRRYTADYVAAEARASKRGSGIWQGAMQAPSAYRANRAKLGATDCKLKGNISRGGKIYHLPGQEYYEITRINARKGERWFCTESEARAAGWRKAWR